jgi:hypothetical protein
MNIIETRTICSDFLAKIGIKGQFIEEIDYSYIDCDYLALSES